MKVQSCKVIAVQRAGLGAVASVFRQPGAALDLEINVEVNEIPGLRIPPLL